MFAQIKSVVDVVTGGFKSVRDFKSKRDRDNAIVGMLRFYFFLKDCVEEGEDLIVEAGSNPVAKVAALPADQVAATVRRWDGVLRRQGVRLRNLEGLLFGQDHLAVIDPGLQKALSKAIGYKMNRAVTLHGIGAGLFMRCVFPMNESDQDKAKLVAVMAGERSRDTLNLKRIRAEIAELKGALQAYRDLVDRLATDEEILQLSKKARQTTRLPREDEA